VEAEAFSVEGVASSTMRGYDRHTYGDAFADVYDDWYADVTDVEATVARIVELAGPTGAVLELGVGTGRLAVPIAAAGLQVTGIDSSAAMLARLAARDGGGRVTTIEGDMVDRLPPGPFDVVLIAYNTIFNLLDESEQRRCFTDVAARLRPGGAFVVEAFVPDDDADGDERGSVTVRSIAADRVVLSVSTGRRTDQRAEGQFVELTEAGGVRLRPWAIRWSTPAQLDAMAAAAGLTLDSRTADMAGTPYDDDSDQHVSVYRKRPA
jgi:SAM-dependent methyltransferase